MTFLNLKKYFKISFCNFFSEIDDRGYVDDHGYKIWAALWYITLVNLLLERLIFFDKKANYHLVEIICI